MANFIVGGMILTLVCLASGYIYKEKKRGVRCIGCPSAGTCGKSHEASDCGCGCQTH